MCDNTTQNNFFHNRDKHIIREFFHFCGLFSCKFSSYFHFISIIINYDIQLSQFRIAQIAICTTVFQERQLILGISIVFFFHYEYNFWIAKKLFLKNFVFTEIDFQYSTKNKFDYLNNLLIIKSFPSEIFHFVNNYTLMIKKLTENSHVIQAEIRNNYHHSGKSQYYLLFSMLSTMMIILAIKLIYSCIWRIF